MAGVGAVGRPRAGNRHGANGQRDSEGKDRGDGHDDLSACSASIVHGLVNLRLGFSGFYCQYRLSLLRDRRSVKGFHQQNLAIECEA